MWTRDRPLLGMGSPGSATTAQGYAAMAQLANLGSVWGQAWSQQIGGGEGAPGRSAGHGPGIFLHDPPWSPSTLGVAGGAPAAEPSFNHGDFPQEQGTVSPFSRDTGTPLSTTSQEADIVRERLGTDEVVAAADARWAAMAFGGSRGRRP